MAQIHLPYQLTNGTVADATQVMANFNAIVNVVNGNLGSDNIGNITGAEIVTNDINGGQITLDNYTRRFQVGFEWMENVPTHTTYSRQVNFHRPFPGAPFILFGKHGHRPHLFHFSYGNVTNTGFTVWFRSEYETDRERVGVPWLAIYLGAMS